MAKRRTLKHDAKLASSPKSALSGKELAALAGVSESTLSRYREQGLVTPDVIRGKRAYYSRAEAKRFVAWFGDPNRLIGQRGN